MPVIVRQVGADALSVYASIPTAFKVEETLRVELIDEGLSGMRLLPEPVAEPWLKDYDSQGDLTGDAEGERPSGWAKRFDISNWAFFLAHVAEQMVGGAAVAFRTPEVRMLDRRDDLAVLWDIRVRTEWRRCGVGAVLFRKAASWAREQGCRHLMVETQNINVGACRFYAAQGCRLGAINRYAYDASYPDEVMLLWYLDL